MHPPTILQPPPRSRLVTLLAWVTMGIGVIGLPISFISLLMVLAHSYGTANANFLETCLFVMWPCIALGVGFALWRRWRVGGIGIVGMLVIFILMHSWKLLAGPTPSTPGNTYTYTSASGVKTTVIGAGTNYHSLPILLLCAGTLAKLLTRRVWGEFSSAKSRWSALNAVS